MRSCPTRLRIMKLNIRKCRSSETGQHHVFVITSRDTRSGCLRAKSRPIGPPQSVRNSVASRTSRCSSSAAKRSACAIGWWSSGRSLRDERPNPMWSGAMHRNSSRRPPMRSSRTTTGRSAELERPRRVAVHELRRWVSPRPHRRSACGACRARRRSDSRTGTSSPTPTRGAWRPASRSSRLLSVDRRYVTRIGWGSGWLKR